MMWYFYYFTYYDRNEKVVELGLVLLQYIDVISYRTIEKVETYNG